MTEEECAQQEDAADDHAYARSPFGGWQCRTEVAISLDPEWSISVAAPSRRTALRIERRHDEGGGGHTPPPVHATWARDSSC